MITVEAGITGKHLDEVLCAAHPPSRSTAEPSVCCQELRQYGLCLGHEPDSFEFSSVGGCPTTAPAHCDCTLSTFPLQRSSHASLASLEHQVGGDASVRNEEECVRQH